MNDIQQKHVSVLTEHVFDVRKSWPQFRLLLNDIVSLSDKFGEDHTIAALERTILYGGLVYLHQFSLTLILFLSIAVQKVLRKEVPIIHI